MAVSKGSSPSPLLTAVLSRLETFAQVGQNTVTVRCSGFEGQPYHARLRIVRYAGGRAAAAVVVVKGRAALSSNSSVQ